MMHHAMWTVCLFLQGIVVIFIAPLFMGWIKQVKCWLQNRSAPSLIQPYFQLRKLLIKQPVLAENASWLFQFAPYVYFSCLALLCFVLPFFWISGLATSWIDVIVLTGLLALARVILALAAMDVGTAFGSLGARREIFIACLTEPVLLLVFLNVALLTHAAHLNAMSLYFIAHPVLYPSLFFSLVALLMITLAETGRVPIDNPATHLELTMIHEAMILEYSGRYLALIEWGNSIKFIIYLLLFIALFFPYGLSDSMTFSAWIISIFTTLLKLFALALFIGVIESFNVKIRIFKVTEYLAGALMLAILGLLLTQLLGTT